MKPDEQYFADDGLMSLRKLGFIPSYNNDSTTTVQNDNGILYLAMYFYLKGEVQWDWFKRSMELTRHATAKGLYHRNPGRTGRSKYINSHDNYTGMACGCILAGDDLTFKEIVEYGKKNWYILNDERPGRHLKTKMGHPSGLHQPHSWFIYQLAAGQEPGWLTTIWNIGNLLHTAFLVPHYTHHDSHLLAWLRIQAIMIRIDLLTGWKRKYTLRAMIAFQKQMKVKSRGIGVYFNYFGAKHPNRIMGVEER